MKAKQLIITSAFGQHVTGLPDAFLQSAASLRLECDLMVIRHACAPELERSMKTILPTASVAVPINFTIHQFIRRFLQKTGTVRLVTRALRWLARSSALGHRFVSRIAPYFLGITSGRYFLAKHIIEAAQGKYSHVLLTDSRDVIFQRDPFRDLTEGVRTGIEPLNLAEEPNNWSWLKIVYPNDEDLMKSLADKRIICSGVTGGTTADMLSYLDVFCREAIERLPEIAYIQLLDQAIHNKLLWGRHKLRIVPTDNTGGWVATLAVSKLDEFQPDWSTGLRTLDGTLVSIVHQFDRHPKLESELLTRGMASMPKIHS